MIQDEHIRRDLSLLERVAADDSTALVELYDRHAPRLYSIINRTLKVKSSSEYVLQSLFVDLWKNIEPYDFRIGTPSAWLCRLARNRAVEYLRTKDSRDRLHGTTIENIHELFAADFREDAEHHPYLTGQQEEVLIALTSLSDQQKTIIEFAYFRGYTYKELAEHLSVSTDTLKSRIRTTVSILRQKLRHRFL
jgi:RNA polymerase sigma-70 factor (ECF subfamily)